MAASTTTRSKKSTGRAGKSKATRKTSTRSTASRGRAAGAGSRSGRGAGPKTAKTRKSSRTGSKAARNRRNAGNSAGGSRGKDVIGVLTKDHREVEALFQRYERLGGKAEKSRRTIARKLVEELSKHAAAEEQVLYPALRSMLSNGEKMQKEGIDEHQTVKELLVDLNRLSPGDEEFDPKMRALIENVRHHVEEEEGEMLPKLAKAAGREQLQAMGQMIQAAKKIAPTRPHPHTPSTPPANVVVGAVAGVVDRVRDAGRKVLAGGG